MEPLLCFFYASSCNLRLIMQQSEHSIDVQRDCLKPVKIATTNAVAAVTMAMVASMLFCSWCFIYMREKVMSMFLRRQHFFMYWQQILHLQAETTKQIG